MLDFRYHALSLVAVFLALGIGIVLGSSLGDTVVSQANKDIASSLRGDLLTARRQAHDANARVGQRDRFATAAFPLLAGDALRGRVAAIVASGALPSSILSNTRDAVQTAGGTPGTVAALRSPPDLTSLGKVVGPRFAALRSNDPRLRPMGRRVGAGLVRGGKLARRLAKRFPDRFSGHIAPANAVTLYRDPAADRSDAEKQFEQGLVEGLRAGGTTVVGVEATDTDPSQISFFSNAGLSSVDNVDTPAGRIALALALAGAHGSFGFKKTADGPLPGHAPGG